MPFVPTWTVGPSRGRRRPGALGRWPTATRPPDTCLQLPVKTSLNGLHLHPMCSPTADLQRTHTRAAGAFQFSSLYRLFHELPTSFGVTTDSPDQLQGRRDRWDLFEMSVTCRKAEKTWSSFDTKFVHKLIQNNPPVAFNARSSWLQRLTCQLCSSSALKSHGKKYCM